MKKFYQIILLLLAALLLLGCAGGNSTKKPESYADENNRLNTRDGMVATHDGILYTCITASDGYYVYATELDTGKTVPLCNKPECTHDDKNCNAALSADACLMSLYDGRLYWLSGVGSAVLSSMALDGTDRRVELELKKEYEMMLVNGSMALYNGKLYRCGVGEGISDAEIYQGGAFYSQKIANGSEPVELLRFDNAYSALSRLDGSTLYVAFMFYDRDTSVEAMNLYAYDMDKEELKELYSGEFDGTGEMDMFVSGDKLIFHNGGSRIRSFSLTDGKIEALYANIGDLNVRTVMDDVGIASVDFLNFVCLDPSGKELSKVSLEAAGISDMCNKFPLGSVNGIFYFRLEAFTEEGPGPIYLVSIDPKTGEVKVLTERLHGIYLD